MASGRNVEIDGLEEWQQVLVQMGGAGFDRMKDRSLRTIGLRMQEYLDDLTPVAPGGGRLKQSMSMGGAGNVFDVVVGNRSYVFTGTNVEYAEPVNDGHEQRKGRFVPGEWKSGTFHYIPGHNKGMVLTGKVIPGAFMFDKAMDYIERDIPQVLDFEFRRLYNELF